jgi:hypothetical protein
MLTLSAQSLFPVHKQPGYPWRAAIGLEEALGRRRLDGGLGGGGGLNMIYIRICKFKDLPPPSHDLDVGWFGP